MQLAVSLSVLFVLLGAPFGLVDVAGVAPKAVDQTGQVSLQQADGLDADRVLLRFDVRENGSAVARVEYRFALTDATDEAAFEDLQRDVETNRSRYLDRFERRVNATVASAATETARSMEVTDVGVAAETRQLPAPYGVVEYSFVWHGFARVDDGAVVVGDALGGLYLEEEAELQLSWPASYEARQVHDGAERGDGAAVWTGPTWFDAQGPRLVLARGGAGVDPFAVVLFGLSALFAASGATFWWRVGRGRSDGSAPLASESPTGSEPGDVTPEAATGERPPESTVDRRSPADPEPTTSRPASSAESVDSTLLSNEERVVRELERRGGRAKQQELVGALDWSDAKVSRVVGKLRDRGVVEGFRIGNENVLSLAGARDGGEEDR